MHTVGCRPDSGPTGIRAEPISACVRCKGNLLQVPFVQLAESLHNVGVLIGDIGALTRVTVDVDEEVFNSGAIAAIRGVAGPADEFPVVIAHGPVGIRPRADLPVQRMFSVRSCGAGVTQHAHQTPPIEIRSRNVDASQFRQGGQPVTGVTDLIARLILRELARPGDDCGNPDATFEQAEFRTAIRPGAAASPMCALFGRVTVIALVHDDRLPGQSK